MNIIKTQKKHLHSAAKIMEEAYYDSITEAKKELARKIRSNESFVALEENNVVGVLIYAKSYSHYANYMEDIIVAKNWRRKGVAKKLIEKYVDVSKKQTPKKQKYALSSTDVSNKTSINMHVTCGFKEIGRMKKLHYGKDEIFFAYDLRKKE